MKVGRREFLRLGLLGVAGLVVHKEVSRRSYNDPNALNLFYREEGIFTARLSPVLSNQTGRDKNPYIRREPNIGAEPVQISDRQAHGINIFGSGVVRGFKVWGGTYSSLDGRGMALTHKGRNYGRWFAISDGQRVVGFVAENFVSYLPPKNPK